MKSVGEVSTSLANTEVVGLLQKGDILVFMFLDVSSACSVTCN